MTDAAPEDAAPPQNGGEIPPVPGIRILAQFIRDLSFENPRAPESLRIEGKLVELSRREYELALMLFQNLGRLLSREHLREAIWGVGIENPSRSLDTHISRLRLKLQLSPANGFVLSAVYGLGYRLADDAAVAVIRR